MKYSMEFCGYVVQAPEDVIDICGTPDESIWIFKNIWKSEVEEITYYSDGDIVLSSTNKNTNEKMFMLCPGKGKDRIVYSETPDGIQTVFNVENKNNEWKISEAVGKNLPW